MPKKTISVISLLVILIILFAPSFASVTEMPRDVATAKAVNDFRDSDDIDIFIVGRAVILDNAILKIDQIKNDESLDDIKTTKKYKSIWLTGDAYESRLDKDFIDAYLDKGYSLYFIGLSDPAILGQLIFSLADDDSSLLKTMLASTWNRKNDWNLSRRSFEKNMLSVINGKVSAAAGEDFSIGSDWKCRFGWKQYIVNDLWLTDYSEPSFQKMNLLFSYDRTSNYAKQTTYAGSGVFVNTNGTLHYQTIAYK